MKRKLVSLLLALTVLAALPILPARAADSTDAVALVQALGIMTGDQNGNLNLSRNVTRAEFAKMLVSASSFKNSSASAGYSLFKDIKSGHWASGYIKIAVEQGWFNGYLDGTFRPNNPITFEEAATVALRLLGYTAADLTGAYPMAQISKFESLDLHDGFSAARGQYMTRSDCAHLFANLMSAKTKEGTVYAKTLGYDLDASGHLDYTSLVSADTKGPYTLTGSIQDLISFSPTQVYRNGAAASLSEAERYDVCYYNSGLKTVWLFSDRVTGSYSAASPSTAAPESVTVAGQTYSIETSSAAYALSDQGSYRIGDTVTLLLGMNGGVADVRGAAETSGVFYGVVKSQKDETVRSPDGTFAVKRVLTVFCTDGVERVFEAGSLGFTPGTAVLVDYSAANPLSYLPTTRHAGVFSSGRFGDFKLAQNVEIIDSDRYGNAKQIYADRLSGSTLDLGNVLYYQLNAKGELSRLILRDATGDASVYGLVLTASESKQDVISGSYRFLINGAESNYATTDSILHLSTGAARLTYDADGKLSQAANLTRLHNPTLNGQSVYAGDKRYAVVESTQFYIRRDGGYFETTLDSIRDGYDLDVYGDDLGYPAGMSARIIVATAKSD